jgi:hypothetical protein
MWLTPIIFEGFMEPYQLNSKIFKMAHLFELQLHPKHSPRISIQTRKGQQVCNLDVRLDIKKQL